jgi:hypothetical protein
MEINTAMVEVFSTNVERMEDAKKLIDLLQQHFPASRINFDLHDCDRILRVEASEVCTEKITALMQEHNFRCNLLE